MSIESFDPALRANVDTIAQTDGILMTADADRAARIRWVANVLATADIDPRDRQIKAIQAVKMKAGGLLSVADAKALVLTVARLMGPLEPLGLFMVERQGPIWPGNVVRAVVAARTAVEAENLAYAQEADDADRRWFRTSSTTQRIGQALDLRNPTVMVTEVAS